KITMRAAKHFAIAFLEGLASNRGLAASVKHGRVAIQRSEPLPQKNPSNLASVFAPFVPVLVQRTPQDCPLVIDIAGRNLTRMLLRMQGEMEQVSLYIDRV